MGKLINLIVLPEQIYNDSVECDNLPDLVNKIQFQLNCVRGYLRCKDHKSARRKAKCLFQTASRLGDAIKKFESDNPTS